MEEKKVLIITYYWPPSGGGGVQRWLKMSKYLPEFGWKPIIFTPENPDFELTDDSLLKDVAKDTDVLKLPIWEPFGLYRKLMGKKAAQKQGVVNTNDVSFFGKLSRWVRGNWFIPDARIFWVRPAVNYLTKYVKNNPVDMIISTGPPHSMHLIAMEVKRRTGVKWLADFRDPWSDWDVLPQLSLTKKSWATHKKLERNVMNQADRVLTVTNNLAAKLAETGGVKHVHVVSNGFDAQDFLQQTDCVTPNKFKMAHVGLLNEGRNPVNLWQILAELCNENKTFKNDLKIVLAGTIEQSVRESIGEHHQLKEKVQILDYLSHTEVLALYQQSAVLVLLVNNTSNSSWILPGKLFEYFSARKPILAIGQLESEANEVLTSCGYNSFLTYNDKINLKARVWSLYESFKKSSVLGNANLINRYERKELTGNLAKLLNELVA